MNYLLIDTREKPKATKSILKYFDNIGLIYESTKLLFGDYMDFNRPYIVIDRKQNIAELAKNCTTEHERFRRELERAKRANATLVILIEQKRYKDRGEWREIEKLSDIIYWSNEHTMVTGERIYRILTSWMAKYPIRVEFCDKKSTGKRIYEIIYEEHDGQE